MIQTPPITEAFLEQNWDDAGAARAARDNRAAQLQAAGYVCTCSDLWNVAGYRVYVLSAKPAAEAKRIVPVSNAGGATDEGSSPSLPRRPDDRKQRPARRRSATEIH